MSTEDVKAAVKGTDWSLLGKLLPAAVSALKNSTEFKDIVRKSPIAPAAKAVYRSLKRAKGATVSHAAPPSERDNGELPLIYPPRILIDQLAARVEFSTAKAERLLGFKPRYFVKEGMGITREWAAWANLLGPRF
jgi:nucleoside-diphosphate-sugar epimerase